MFCFRFILIIKANIESKSDIYDHGLLSIKPKLIISVRGFWRQAVVLHGHWQLRGPHSRHRGVGRVSGHVWHVQCRVWAGGARPLCVPLHLELRDLRHVRRLGVGRGGRGQAVVQHQHWRGGQPRGRGRQLRLLLRHVSCGDQCVCKWLLL